MIMAGKTNIIIIGVIIVVVGVIGSAYVNVLGVSEETQAIDWADPGNKELVTRGAVIYDEVCGTCHGNNLQGQPDWRTKTEDGMLPAPPHDASGHTWHHPDQLLFEITKFGGQKNAPEGFISAMPEFGDILNDEEIWASLAYIKSRWPENIRKRHAQMSERMKVN
ncbi:MAG: c-type cytochrome [Rhodospirillaceae bacterium]|jgi:mono/diheme cytochrome c family protein|nr:c-type cytochrome [Rhodospirillaceae bacterium]MBT5242639.1 c-type cytochrome [Rhodospirillaceae bacterium]MBT5562802.1 c-type cytochrome [Rhodospirillaceae bacterium]MBT6241231.1 c-type cytochrome [Rhodospirillaceae bacterium]MBT7137520.1 c-type cytochrome [Rhodospirillaceae bacterium]